MDRTLSTDPSKESKRLHSITLQRKMAEENRRKAENAPDLTDFMNDMFFGTVNNKEKKSYNLSGGRLMDEEVDFDDSIRSNSSQLTEEWLEEARRIVASSPARCDSPSRIVGSPRFGAAQPRLLAASLDRRDPLSRSARRHRPVEGFGGEILSKSAKHSGNISLDKFSTKPLVVEVEQSPTAAVHKWFSNILNKCSNPPPGAPSPADPTAMHLLHRQSTHRRSRFQNNNTAPHSQGVTQQLSPQKDLAEAAAHKRSLSSSSGCPSTLNQPLSPPKNLVESAHRRSISKSTCYVEKSAPKNANGWCQEEDGSRDNGLNGFLKERRIIIDKILCGEVDSKVKIVLPGPSNSTSSMVAAICYAWLLENRTRKNKKGGDGYVVVPLMNVKRDKMWKHQQAAWLFHHVGLDATSLLFADEVDLEMLLMSGNMSIIVVGEDVLRTNGEVGSQCTILTDNYCEDAYDLLQTPILRKLLLAGILLDTKNLDSSSGSSITRDAEAVQLLLVGSSPNYRNNLCDQLMQDHKDSSFLEALRNNYGKPASENGQETGSQVQHKVSEMKPNPKPDQEKAAQNSKKNSPNAAQATAAASPAPTKASSENSRGKNKFFLAKWFGFGSK